MPQIWMTYEELAGMLDCTVMEAREAAETWLALDPALRTPESAALRAVVEHRWKGRLGLAEIG